MPKPILYLFRGEHSWMLSEEILGEEGGQPSRAAATPLLRDVDVETALKTVQAQLPDYDIRLVSKLAPTQAGR